MNTAAMNIHVQEAVWTQEWNCWVLWKVYHHMSARGGGFLWLAPSLGSKWVQPLDAMVKPLSLSFLGWGRGGGLCITRSLTVSSLG